MNRNNTYICWLTNFILNVKVVRRQIFKIGWIFKYPLSLHKISFESYISRCSFYAKVRISLIGEIRSKPYFIHAQTVPYKLCLNVIYIYMRCKFYCLVPLMEPDSVISFKRHSIHPHISYIVMFIYWRICVYVYNISFVWFLIY